MAQSNPDLSEFFKYSRPPKSPCRVGYALSGKELKGDEKTQLESALKTDKGLITAGAIQEWGKRRKITLTASSVVNHRKESCSCYDD